VTRQRSTVKTTGAELAGSPSGLRRFVPILRWAPDYQPAWLTRDVIAGVTIWGLLIPEMIAYASLAGLPPQAGLYTLLASLVLYAIFGTSRHLVVAGTSASAVLIFSTVTALHPKDPGKYAALAAGMVILTGLFFVVAGLFRCGFITSFLSRPVMEGFVFGLAIFVTVSQLPKLFGLKKGEGDTVRQLAHLLLQLGHTSVLTLVVGLAALALLFGLERFLPRLPGGLVVLVLAITVSAAGRLSQHGVEIVGKIPGGLPSLSSPHLKATELWVLVPSAAGMMLVIFSEALGAGQTFADKHGYRLDSSQEMIALGFANIGSGFLGGLACGGSLSQTAVNDGAGAKSEASPIVAAVLSLVTVVALTPLFRDLPEAVLAALIVHAVSHLMKVPEMRSFYRLMPREFWLAMITLLSVIVLDVLPALVIGVSLSIVLLAFRASRPRVVVLGALPGSPGSYGDLDRHPDAVQLPGLVLIRPNGPLFYANAQSVRDTIEARSTEAGNGGAVVVDLDANNDIDITTAEQLAKLADTLGKRRIRLALAHLHGSALEMAGRSGLLQRIGTDRVFPTLSAAVGWAQHDRSLSEADVAAPDPTGAS
jgi:sulfate permease, SulP family